MTHPKYSGNTEYISTCVDVNGYFQDTLVADWSLVDFLLSGENENIFLEGVRKLMLIKDLGRDVQGFARSLAVYYSVKQNVVIAKNDAELTRNRDALKGFEHRSVQSELQNGFVNTLNSSQPSSQDVCHLSHAP
ncbi:hypothetical protein BGZ76_008188, partial [Entomortierella beljakovae]